MAWGVLLVTLVLVLAYGNCYARSDSPKLDGGTDRRRILVISLDGFSRSYIRNFQWKHFSMFYARGSAPIRFRNQFITKTFPNHFSIGTGVYEEVHGVIANDMFDPDLNRTLTIDDEGFFTQNPDIVPVWTLNEENGGHSGCVMWPGCGATFHGQNVTFWHPWKSKAKIKESISMAIQWFTHAETPANLVFLYHEQPDAAGHAYGPNSTYITDELQKIDEGIGYLFRSLDLHDLRDALDIIVLSDHGMSAIPEANIIDLDDIISPSLYHFTGSSPVLNIWTDTEQDLTVYTKLEEGSKTHAYKVYFKEQIPEEWHYQANNRISRILVVADDGYVFQDFRNLIDTYKKEGLPGMTDVHGDHGYPVNVASMEPIFVALGPSFKHRFTAPSFSNVDVYPLLCHLLSLTPGPNNGTLQNISTILSQPIASALIQPLLIALGCLVGLMAVIGVTACALSKKDSRRRVSADSLINGYIHRKTLRIGSIRLSDDDEGDASEEEGLLESEVVIESF